MVTEKNFTYYLIFLKGNDEKILNQAFWCNGSNKMNGKSYLLFTCIIKVTYHIKDNIYIISLSEHFCKFNYFQ